ncbi:hypothetical protein C1645_745546 [Glomus cerebriforme]|uniref:Apple domain-containing protein n=1 Tax=Glomus cerebriforme TaxID=658196 RepID=A0A397S3D3_9GLOM|nr:hypothetical protein C1645_745546 [Glomus cerebriforme]
MNRKTFNLFLIVLLALIIIVDAHNHNYHHHHHHDHHDHHNRKTCTITKTGSHTVTVTKTKSCSNEPTPTNHISCHVRNDWRRHNRDNDRDNCKHCKATKTVTCTPTITLCPTPTPKCCETAGGPGFQNKFHQVLPENVAIIPNIVTNIDCCKACFGNPACVQWAFPDQCVTHVNQNGLGDICANNVISTDGIFGSGIVRCSGDGDNCLA